MKPHYNTILESKNLISTMYKYHPFPFKFQLKFQNPITNFNHSISNYNHKPIHIFNYILIHSTINSNFKHKPNIQPYIPCANTILIQNLQFQPIHNLSSIAIHSISTSQAAPKQFHMAYDHIPNSSITIFQIHPPAKFHKSKYMSKPSNLQT